MPLFDQNICFYDYLKIPILILALLSWSTFYSQKEKNKATPFVTVYDLNGIKISKGRIAVLTDTSLVTGPREKPVTIEVTSIGSIKTKRSAGHNILMGAVIGTGTGAILGFATGGEGEWWGKGEGAGGFGFIFGAMGAGIGAITAIFKKTNTFSIDGDTIKWKAFREAIGEQSPLP
ncbi:hypothetical protein [uncultured Eudoraea sp.]|uniref:hypothetical protein n=1 Tax=uncultured Eudoraea sp. TaxID=1035614 RepID=UPI002614FF75|nr:hypothetical protein [uncultured Eudoraea sp.]